mmetsp:Transcript_4715/g.17439  ORF Transcript_4715/g.17439 Transcript_4715/m.17439 type:complete len:213 (-) Transcript_4715:1963-2601(-)
MVPSSLHRSTIFRISEYFGRKTRIPPGIMFFDRYRSNSCASAFGHPSASCALAVKSPRASLASTWIWFAGTTCGASTLIGKLTPSSPSKDPIGDRVPLVIITHRAATLTGRNATLGRRHHSATPGFLSPSSFAGPIPPGLSRSPVTQSAYSSGFMRHSRNCVAILFAPLTAFKPKVFPFCEISRIRLPSNAVSFMVSRKMRVVKPRASICAS